MISVIVPNYNHSLYLKKRIDSILNQTYKDIELILLDDCSTDDSRVILEQYRNNALISHIIYNEENSGSTFKQWQKGIELAKGDFIWIAESDDWAEPFMLEKLIGAIDNDTSIAFCHSLRIWLESDMLDTEGYTYSYNIYNGKDFIEKCMLKYNTIENASMAIFRKSDVDLAWFDEIGQMKYCGDWMFWVKLATKGTVVEFTETFNYFRQHAAKVTPNAKRLGLDFIEGMKILAYIEASLGIKISIDVIRHWAQIWINTRHLFDRGIKTVTLQSLISYKSAFLYYIPFEMIKKKIGIQSK